MITLADKIKQLQSEIEKCQNEIKNCKHIWGNIIFDSETVKEPIYDHLEPCGSDPYPVFRWVDKTIPRWSRKCKECGKVEHTYTEEIVSVKKEPKF